MFGSGEMKPRRQWVVRGGNEGRRERQHHLHLPHLALIACICVICKVYFFKIVYLYNECVYFIVAFVAHHKTFFGVCSLARSNYVKVWSLVSLVISVVRSGLGLMGRLGCFSGVEPAHSLCLSADQPSPSRLIFNQHL